MTDFLLLAFVFLIAGVVAVPIASRFGLGSVVGYLIAGIAISPLLALLHVDVVSIQHFAEFGVVMMLFLAGLELEPRKLWDMRVRLVGLGGFQLGATALLVMGAAMVLGQPWSVGLAVGLVLALSSTAIVLQTLTEKGLMRSDGGQASFSVLLFQDIAVIPMLALIPLLALPELAQTDTHGAADHSAALSLVSGLNGWQTAIVTVAAVGFVVVGGSTLTGPVFRFISKARLRELFTATALMMVIGIALLMTLVGLSPALGTFLAGVVLANSEYRHELESDLDPFKGLLLGVFFMTVGAAIDFAVLFASFWTILGLTLGLMAIKVAVLLALGRIFRLEGSDKWLFGLSLAQAGEFGFVLLGFTVASNVMPQAVADKLLLVVALSMLLTPALFILHDRVLVPRYSRGQEREPDEIEAKGSVIVAGHGRVGGLVNRMLRGAGYQTTVIDYSDEQLKMLRAFGFHVYYGDATRPDLLHAAGIAEARLLVIAIDDKAQITQMVRHVLAHYPDCHVIARALDRQHVYDLYAAGCRDIVRDYFDSSIRMGRSAIEALGVPHAEAVAKAKAFEDMDRKFMIEVAPLYDPDIPTLQNQPYVEKVRQMTVEWESQLTANMAQPPDPEGVIDEATEALATSKVVEG